jgi:hypothetical protein
MRAALYRELQGRTDLLTGVTQTTSVQQAAVQQSQFKRT